MRRRKLSITVRELIYLKIVKLAEANDMSISEYIDYALDRHSRRVDQAVFADEDIQLQLLKKQIEKLQGRNKKLSKKITANSKTLIDEIEQLLKFWK